MPRRRSRFKSLREKLRAVGGTPSGSGEVSKYFQYITGQSEFTIPNAIDGDARNLLAIAVIPFASSAVADTPEERIVTQISTYSWNKPKMN